MVLEGIILLASESLDGMAGNTCWLWGSNVWSGAGDSGLAGELQRVPKIKPQASIKIRNLKLKTIKWDQKESSGTDQRWTLGVEVEWKLEAEEERKTPDHMFKTGDRSQNELSLSGERSRGCGSETGSQPWNPHACFCTSFPKDTHVMQGLVK